MPPAVGAGAGILKLPAELIVRLMLVRDADGNVVGANLGGASKATRAAMRRSMFDVLAATGQWGDYLVAAANRGAVDHVREALARGDYREDLLERAFTIATRNSHVAAVRALWGAYRHKNYVLQPTLRDAEARGDAATVDALLGYWIIHQDDGDFLYDMVTVESEMADIMNDAVDARQWSMITAVSRHMNPNQMRTRVALMLLEGADTAEDNRVIRILRHAIAAFRVP